MFMTSVTFIDLAGEDLQDQIQQAAKDLPIPVRYVPAPGFGGDLYRGYAQMMEAVMGQMDWSAPPSKAEQVSLLGYLFDRYERDHTGNFTHLQKMLNSLGMSLGPSLFNGSTYEETLRLPESGLIIDLPYTRPRAKAIHRKLKNRSVVTTDLPMGLRGTSRWLRTVAEAAGTWTPERQARIGRMEARTRKRVEVMFDRWRGLRVAVFADPAHGAGLVSLLLEMGIEPVLVGLKGTTMGGKTALMECLDRDGNPLPEGTEILENPSISLIQERLREHLTLGRLDGVFGSAVDINALASLPPDVFRGNTQDPYGPFTVETGFPCKDYHALYPMPFLGYQGVEAWVQRLISAPRLWNSGNPPQSTGF
jgi:nitrogenase molybdenum-iron protein alpha/beta subunit